MSHKGFIAENKNITFYNGIALLNFYFTFFYNEDGELKSELNVDNGNDAFLFAGYSSGYMSIYDERNGQLIKTFTTQITRNSNKLVFNCSVSDMTFENLGNYFYEIGYVMSGYDRPLNYGDVKII
jgi:hypothetical protein